MISGGFRGVILNWIYEHVPFFWFRVGFIGMVRWRMIEVEPYMVVHKAWLNDKVQE